VLRKRLGTLPDHMAERTILERSTNQDDEWGLALPIEPDRRAID
jgi:hypothetical protein